MNTLARTLVAALTALSLFGCGKDDRRVARPSLKGRNLSPKATQQGRETTPVPTRGSLR